MVGSYTETPTGYMHGPKVGELNLPKTYKRPNEIPREIPACFKELNELIATHDEMATQGSILGQLYHA